MGAEFANPSRRSNCSVAGFQASSAPEAVPAHQRRHGPERRWVLPNLVLRIQRHEGAPSNADPGRAIGTVGQELDLLPLENVSKRFVLRVEEVEPLEGADPEGAVRVCQQGVDGVVVFPVPGFALRVAQPGAKRLHRRVPEAEAPFARSHPKPSVAAGREGANVPFLERARRLVGAEAPHLVAVVPVEAVLGAHPEKAEGILLDGGDVVLRQPLVLREALEAQHLSPTRNGHQEEDGEDHTPAEEPTHVGAPPSVPGDRNGEQRTSLPPEPKKGFGWESWQE